MLRTQPSLVDSIFYEDNRLIAKIHIKSINNITELLGTFLFPSPAYEIHKRSQNVEFLKN